MAFLSYVRNQWDRVAAWGCVVLGAVALFAGWLGVSSHVYPAEQNSYIASGGFLGLFLLGVGAMMWISADLRDEWRKLDDIEQALRTAAERPAPAGPGPEDERRAPARRSEPSRPRASRRVRT